MIVLYSDDEPYVDDVGVDNNGVQSTTNDPSSQLCFVCVISQEIPALPLGCPLCASVIISTSDKPPKYQRGSWFKCQGGRGLQQVPLPRGE